MACRSIQKTLGNRVPFNAGNGIKECAVGGGVVPMFRTSAAIRTA